MTVSKPSIISKTPTTISKYIAGGTRSKTTKIAWHYTGKADVKGINTINNWFNQINKGYKSNGSYVYASSHFVCDLDGKIYSYVPMSRIAYTTNSANSYSIGIECATTGSDDHYTDEEYKSMVKLGAWLCQYYGLDPRKDFIRHYDITKKVCPRYFVNNSAKWEQFKLDCYNYMKGTLKDSGIKNCTVSTATFKQYIIRTTATSLNGREGAGTSYDVVIKLPKGTAVTIVSEKTVSGTKWLRTKSGYWISSAYTEFVRYV